VGEPKPVKGEPKPESAEDALEQVRGSCSESNRQLLASMKEAQFANELMELTCKDARLGRMSRPVPVEECDLSGTLLTPRFGVEQGLKPDGSVKVRAVDNLSWSHVPEGSTRWRSKGQMKTGSINGHCKLEECIKHDHLDDLLRAVALFKELDSSIPALWKADIDAAFRCKLRLKCN